MAKKQPTVKQGVRILNPNKPLDTTQPNFKIPTVPGNNGDGSGNMAGPGAGDQGGNMTPGGK